MQAGFVQAPAGMLEQRRRLGLDSRDEMWEGVVHLVPPASGPHHGLATDLLLVLRPIARQRGLRPSYETGLFRSASDYRVPDQLYCLPGALSERGAESAELVVEIRSPGDEIYAKLDCYATLGVRELLVVHPDDQRVELLRLVGDRLLPVTADAEGAIRSETLGVRFAPGPPLRLSWDGGTAEL